MLYIELSSSEPFFGPEFGEEEFGTHMKMAHESCRKPRNAPGARRIKQPYGVEAQIDRCRRYDDRRYLAKLTRRAFTSAEVNEGASPPVGTEGTKSDHHS